MRNNRDVTSAPAHRDRGVRGRLAEDAYPTPLPPNSVPPGNGIALKSVLPSGPIGSLMVASMMRSLPDKNIRGRCQPEYRQGLFGRWAHPRHVRHV